MLVLTRKVRQGIVIGDTVVEVIKIKGGSVCLGVTAPPNVNIVRDELLDKKDDSDGRRS